MINITEGHLVFTFHEGWQATQLDLWDFYHKRFKKISNGVKCADFLAISPEREVWLIEVKDYRVDRTVTATELVDVVVEKILHSLGLLMAACFQSEFPIERNMARDVAQQQVLKVVLHMEQPRHRSRLRSRPIDPASMKQTLRKRLKVTGVVQEVQVVDVDKVGAFPWVVTSQLAGDAAL